MTALRDLGDDLDVANIFQSADPFGALSEARDRSWIARSFAGVHVLSFDAALDLLRDRRFDTDAARLLDAAGITDAAVRDLWCSALFGSDSADHDRMRSAVAPYFTTGAITVLREYVDDLTTRHATPLAGAGEVDVVQALTSRIPPATFARMIGAPEEDAGLIGAWSDTIVQLFARQPELAGAIETAVLETDDYVVSLIEARRGAPADTDMISALLASAGGGDGQLSTTELRAIVIEALEVSTPNITGVLNGLLYVAAQHSDRWQDLRRDPDLVPAFVEEVNRLWPRIVHVARIAEHGLTWRGIDIPGGAELLVCVPSAMRDPEAFENPERFDPMREYPPAHNLNYGSGRHHCIAAALTRMQLTVALQALTRVWANVELAAEPELDANVGVFTIGRLPLRITPV